MSNGLLIILMVVYGVNIGMAIKNQNFSAGCGWFCALVMAATILT